MLEFYENCISIIYLIYIIEIRYKKWEFLFIFMNCKLAAPKIVLFQSPQCFACWYNINYNALKHHYRFIKLIFFYIFYCRFVGIDRKYVSIIYIWQIDVIGVSI